MPWEPDYDGHSPAGWGSIAPHAFAADSLVKARDITVDTMRGVVTLTGTVHSAAERDKAIAIARDTKGVLEVKSNLKVGG